MSQTDYVWLQVNRYTGTTQNAVSLLAGISSRAAKGGATVKYSENDTSIAAGASDVVVVVRSDDEGESHDRANLTMRPEDSDILLRLHARLEDITGPAKRVVVVVISGGPVDTSLPALAQKTITSVIAAWQPGEEGGTAIAQLLWGDQDFSSALAVTAYRQNFTTALAIDNISQAGRGYRYSTDTTRDTELYPYGYGLSYGDWDAPALKWAGAAAPTVHAGSMGNVSVAVTIKNTGTRTGSRPILLFAQRLPDVIDRPTTDGIIWPNKWLVAFGKAKDVAAGAEQTLSLTFGAEEMMRWASSGFEVVAGKYQLTTIDQRGKEAASLALVVTK